MQDTVIAPNDDYNAKTQPMQDLIRENTPKSLFRFRDFNDLTIDAFWQDYIYHSAPIHFNDPHDCLVYINKPLLINMIKQSLMPKNVEANIKQTQNLEQMPDIISKNFPVLEAIVKDLSNISDVNLDNILKTYPNYLPDIEEEIIRLMDNIERTVHNNYKTYPKIACFSENIESTLMWSHYANSHKGFALEYDFTKEQKCLVCENQKGCKDFAYTNLYPVIYSNKRYDATELTTFLLLNQYLMKIEISNHTIPDQLAHTKANIYKGEDWQYEKEWRTFLVCNGNPERNDISVKPKAIYIGAETSPIHQDILVNYAKIKEIETYKMKIDTYSDEFKLTYYEI